MRGGGPPYPARAAQPSVSEHEYSAELLRAKPKLAVELLRLATGEQLEPELLAEIHTASQSFAPLQPPEYAADLVVQLGRPPKLALIVEVQRQPRKAKLWSWPLYVASLWARLHCTVQLLVVAFDRAVVRYYRERPIDIGAMVVRPIFVGPDAIPVITDPEHARAEPEMAVFSQLAHCRGPQAVLVAKAAIAAVLSSRLGARYAYVDLMLSRLSPAELAVLEEWMSQTYEYQSRFFRKLVTESEAKGHANAALAVLEARGIAVPESVANRIRACRDPEQLLAWVKRAAVVDSIDELMD